MYSKFVFHWKFVDCRSILHLLLTYVFLNTYLRITWELRIYVQKIPRKNVFPISASSPSTTSGQSGYPMAFRTNGIKRRRKNNSIIEKYLYYLLLIHLLINLHYIFLRPKIWISRLFSDLPSYHYPGRMGNRGYGNVKAGAYPPHHQAVLATGILKKCLKNLGQVHAKKYRIEFYPE